MTDLGKPFARCSFFKIFFFFFFSYLAALGLRCCSWVFSSCGEWGRFSLVVRRLLTVVVSLVWSTGSRAHGLSSLSSQAPEHRLSSCGAWV